MINYNNLSRDSLAIILLCSNLALDYKVDNVKSFTAIEYSKFAKIILNSSIKRPGNLFELSKEEIESTLLISESEANRILKLLEKSGQLSFQLNELNSIGINVVTRADARYPKVLKEKLKEKCPPVLYCCGDISILDDNLIGVVGSRNIDIDGLEFTKELSKKIVDEGFSLVSGGAKGADSVAQDGVLENGGRVVSFIADSLINRIKKREIREAIVNNKLLVISAINPRSGFTVYSAMDRNKYIYCLSKSTVVISSDYNKGGTWTGAIENLKNKWVRLIVRSDEKVPKGNIELIKKGGIKISSKNFKMKFLDLIETKNVTEEVYYTEDLLSLLNDGIKNNINNDGNDSDSIEIKDNSEIIEMSNTEVESNKEKREFDAYYLVIKNIQEVLVNGLSLNEFSELLNVNKKQASDWLNRAVEDGKIKKLRNPVKYITK